MLENWTRGQVIEVACTVTVGIGLATGCGMALAGYTVAAFLTGGLIAAPGLIVGFLSLGRAMNPIRRKNS